MTFIPRPDDAAGSDRFPWVEVSSGQDLQKWLTEHHAQQDPVWLVTFRKAAPRRYVTHEDVLDLLVAFGWIDGIRRQIDDQRTRQLISPRRTQTWAKTYKDRADRLGAGGRMHPAGQHTVDVAKETGEWDAMNDVDALIVPEDLRQTLDSNPPAGDHFNAFPPSARRNILRWIASAKTDPTRKKRINLTVESALRGERVKSNG